MVTAPPAASDAAPLLPQLQALCAAHPHAPKIVFVPRIQLGRALEDAVARAAGGWAGLVGLTPRHYAEQLAEAEIRASGRTEFPVEGRSFLVAQMLQELDRDGHFERLPAHHRFASTAADALDTLRLGGVPLDVLRERTETAEAPDTLRAVTACYDRYLDVLERQLLYDDADVFAWATDCVRSGKAPRAKDAVIAIQNEVNLSECAYRFLRALRKESRAFYRIGAVDPGTPPPQTAAALFRATTPPPGASNGTETAATEGVAERRFGRAVGAANEVKALFRDLLERGVPLDDVEIAYTEGDPYLSLIADQAARMDLPVTVGTGLRAAWTRTGRALRSFYDWITEDFDAAVLIRMLRSGHLRIDRTLDGSDEPAASMEAHEMATQLAARRYEAGREGIRKGIRNAIREKAEHIRELEEKALDPEHEKRALVRLRRTAHLVEELLELAPRTATVRTMAQRSLKFLETFGPVDAPPDDTPEEERTLDESARRILGQRLEKLTRLPFAYETSGVRLAALLRGWIENQYVQAAHPRPGAAHVLPLESAGYGRRSHLYIVGLDSEALSAAAVEDAVLRDRDRRALSASLEGVLPEQRAAPDEALWRMEQAMKRHAGSMSLYTRVFDVESGEERHPSSLFLQLESQHAGRDAAGSEGERIAGFVPDARAEVVLSDAESWLAAYRPRRAGSTSPEATARDALTDTYPWVLDGEAARRARASEVYTEHDGLLGSGPYPALDFFDAAYDGALSAARLETLAETPYLYFLKYVLGVRPIDEPALDDEPWFNHRRRGNLLHATFESFMRSLDGEPPSLDHEPLLRETLQAELEREVRRVAPPSPVEEEAARRQLLDDALLFLCAEVEHAEDHEALHHEVGFGFDPYRRRDGDLGDVALTVEGKTLPLCGSVDRVDRRGDGTLAIWDYKTGSASSFDERNPLQDGATLQWALYAYALEECVGEPVAASGYFFTSVAEMGTRLAFAPDRYRAEVEALLARLARLARSGSFPMNPKADKLGRWRWGGYDRLFRDLKARSQQLKAKNYPPDRPRPPWMDD